MRANRPGLRRTMMPASANRRSALPVAGVVLLVVVVSTLAMAAPGDLDPTFDGDGKATTDFASFTEQAAEIAIQGNGKILAAGGTGDFLLVRYNTNGSLDTTFGGGAGSVTTDFASRGDSAGAVALQADGKIVVAGVASFSSTDDRFALARYNTDGSLDPTFDGDGKVTTEFAPGSEGAGAVVIQADGRIVAAGSASFSMGRHDFALARYNTDGSLDASFDGDGKVVTDFASGDDHGRAAAIQADGKIVATGTTFLSLNGVPRFALARYNTDGSLDSTFDGDGRVETAVTSHSQANAAAIQTDGKIVAAGLGWVGETKDFALARYNSDGSVDATFGGGDGHVITDFAGGSDEANGVAIQVDGKIVAAGCDGGVCEDDPIDNFAVARYATDGSLDTGFGGGDGKVSTDFASGTDLATSMALQRDGKIVAAGFALMPTTGHDFALARYKVCRPTSRRSSIPC
jgi:uncharacterized delta-60 repeat protein